ncbi:MAG: Flp pilus assembly complex ATPase component TadA [Candidatus Omnitrophica bacterium]|nr:Flp pilus assembly complex ATPase component TadA [Candidatus Omnitrophota bacterium]
MQRNDSVRADFSSALAEAKVVSKETLKELVKESAKTGESLLNVLLSAGQFDEKNLLKVLSERYGCTIVNPAVFILEPALLNLIPAKCADQYQVLPIALHEKTLTVAFANPMNVKAVDELRAITNYHIKPVVAAASAIKKMIKKYYFEMDFKQPELDAHQEMAQLIKIIRDQKENDKAKSTAAAALKIAYETPVIRLVNLLILEGIRRKASDIFFEPWEQFVRIRVRVDGLLEEVVCPPKNLAEVIVSRIKIMSELNIAEHRIPQDGRFKVKYRDREVDLRVSILPSSFGEKVCLRILDTKNQGHDLNQLGFTPQEFGIIQASASRPHGMILVTGPTGSGKTTTLYSVLKYLDTPEVNITTVEDPIEYQIPGINQVQAKESIGLTFPAALRSILRQDPDIILIGEIRDRETLDIAVKAALTGHLVLSTLHTNDAASSVTRMANMGLEPFLITSTVQMISAQRLVRRLCQRCRIKEVVSDEVFEQLHLPDRKSHTFYTAKGCAQCRQTGYKGRSVITEILQMKPEISAPIMRGASADEIKTIARKFGMTTLRESAIQKALSGETSLQEVFRVTSEDSPAGSNRKAADPVAEEAEEAA